MNPMNLYIKILNKILANHSDKDSVVLTEEHSHRSMEFNTQCNNRPTQIAPNDFCKGRKVIQWRKSSLFNKCCWNKLGYIYQRGGGNLNLNLNFTYYTKIN